MSHSLTPARLQQLQALGLSFEHGDSLWRDAQDLFRKSYQQDIPQFPKHLLVYYQRGSAERKVLVYVHFTVHETVLLGGGGCVDKAQLRRLPARLREVIAEAGGLYACAVAWAAQNMTEGREAIFGYIGDTMARRAVLSIGYEQVPDSKLVVLWTKALEPSRRTELTRQVAALGPF